MRLQDKVTVITGGAAGIGKATALRFAEEGAKVVICDVNQEAGEALLKELVPTARFDKVNVADRKEVQAWIDSVICQYGRIDVLVNNAGITRDALFVEIAAKLPKIARYAATRCGGAHRNMLILAIYAGLL